MADQLNGRQRTGYQHGRKINKEQRQKTKTENKNINDTTPAYIFGKEGNNTVFTKRLQADMPCAKEGRDAGLRKITEIDAGEFYVRIQEICGLFL